MNNQFPLNKNQSQLKVKLSKENQIPQQIQKSTLFLDNNKECFETKKTNLKQKQGQQTTIKQLHKVNNNFYYQTIAQTPQLYQSCNVFQFDQELVNDNAINMELNQSQLGFSQTNWDKLRQNESLELLQDQLKYYKKIQNQKQDQTKKDFYQQIQEIQTTFNQIIQQEIQRFEQNLQSHEDYMNRLLQEQSLRMLRLFQSIVKYQNSSLHTQSLICQIKVYHQNYHNQLLQNLDTYQEIQKSIFIELQQQFHCLSQSFLFGEIESQKQNQYQKIKQNQTEQQKGNNHLNSQQNSIKKQEINFMQQRETKNFAQINTKKDEANLNFLDLEQSLDLIQVLKQIKQIKNQTINKINIEIKPGFVRELMYLITQNQLLLPTNIKEIKINSRSALQKQTILKNMQQTKIVFQFSQLYILQLLQYAKGYSRQK